MTQALYAHMNKIKIKKNETEPEHKMRSAEEAAQVLEHLCSKHKALSSNPNTAK
jgi:DNA-directed RNA polymerase subunit H (RpoH/RPB5)